MGPRSWTCRDQLYYPLRAPTRSAWAVENNAEGVAAAVVGES